MVPSVRLEGVRVGSSSTMARRRRASATDMPSRDGTWRNGSGTARATVRVIQSPGFQCGAGGRRLQNNGIGLQGGIVADIIDGNGKTGVPQGLDGIGTVLAFQIRYGDGVWPFADGQYEFLPLFDGAARGGLLGDDDAFRLGRVAGIPHDGKLGGALFNLGLLPVHARQIGDDDFPPDGKHGVGALGQNDSDGNASCHNRKQRQAGENPQRGKGK